MSVRGDGDFFKDEWHKLVALSGVVAVAAVVVMKFVLVSEDDESSYGGSSAPAKVAVEAFDLAPIKEVFSRAAKSASLADVPDDAKSFLASEMRVSCSTPEGSAKAGCGKPIPFTDKQCRFCNALQEKEIKVVLDTDGDGLLDDYEKQHGLDPLVADADADKDGDGFTNIEEFQAKTSPSDSSSHPDYIDFLSLEPSFEQEYTHLKFVKKEKIHGKLRFQFKLPGKETELNHGNYRAYEGEKIGETGFVVRSFEAKSKKVRRPGMEMEITITLDEVVVERISDGKRIALVIDKSPTPTDIRAKVVFNHGKTLEFKVAEGEKFKVLDTEFQVLEVKKDSKRGIVKVKNLRTLRERTIDVLDP